MSVPRLDPKQMLKDLVTWSKVYKGTPRKGIWEETRKKWGFACVQSYGAYFGGWINALQEAGLPWSRTLWRTKGRRETTSGYIILHKPNYPSSSQAGYMSEHRYFMEKHLGRRLKKDEWVHHKNGIKTDNRLSNLQIVVLKLHYGKVRCPHCRKQFLVR